MTTNLSDREKPSEETGASFSSSTISTSETSTSSLESSLLLETSASTKSDSTTYSFHSSESISTSSSSMASSPQNNMKELGTKINKSSIDTHKEQYRNMRKNAVTLNLAREHQYQLEEEEEEQYKRRLLLIYFLTWYRALISRHLLICNENENELKKEERGLEADKHVCGHVEEVEIHDNIVNNTYNDKEKQEIDNKYTTIVTNNNATGSSNNNNREKVQALKVSCEEVSLLNDKDIVAEIDKLSPSLRKTVLDIIKRYCLEDSQKDSANKSKDTVKKKELSEKVQQKEENVTREEERKHSANVYRHKPSAKTHFPRTYAVLNEIGEQSLTPCKAIKHELISLLSSMLNNAKTIEINSFTTLEENTKSKNEEMKIDNKNVINNEEKSGHLCKRALLIPVPESLIDDNNKVEYNEHTRGELESKHATNIIDGKGHNKREVKVDRYDKNVDENNLEKEERGHNKEIDHNTSNPDKTKMHYGAANEEIINEANSVKSSAAFYLTRNPSHTPVLTPVEVHERKGQTLETNNNEMTVEHRFHTNSLKSNERNNERQSSADADIANKVLSLIKTAGYGGDVVHGESIYLQNNDKIEVNSNNVDSCKVGRLRPRVIPSPVVSTDDSETNNSKIREEPHREHFSVSESDEYDRMHKLPAYWHVVLQKELQEETNSVLDNQKTSSAHKQHLLHSANHTKYVLCPESEELVTSSDNTAQSPHNKHREHRNPHRRKHHRHARREQKEYESNPNANDNNNRHQHHTMEYKVTPEHNVSHKEHDNNDNTNIEICSGVESTTQSASPIEIVEHNLLLPSNRHDNVNQISKHAGTRLRNDIATSSRRSNSAMPYYVYDGKRYHSIMPMRRQHMSDQVHGKRRALSSSLPSELAWRQRRDREFSPRQVNTMPLRLGRYNPYCSVCRAKFHYMIMPRSTATITPQQKSTLKELEKCGSDYFLCENCRMHGADIFATDLVATCCAQTRKSAHHNSTNVNIEATNNNNNNDDVENDEDEYNTENTIYAKERESNKEEQGTNNSSNNSIKNVNSIANNNKKEMTSTEISMLRR